MYELGSKSLWLDEILQVLVSKNSMPGVLEGVSHHLSPPLDYMILHFFLYFGDSEFIARLPSAIFGILAIILIYAVGKMLFGTKEGLISALLLSISPMHIWYSQEARMYSLFTFLSLLSFFFFYRAIKDNDKIMWIGFTLSTFLCVYTHYFAFFVVLVQALFLLSVRIMHIYERNLSDNIDRTIFSGFIFSIIIVFLLFIPWLNVFLDVSEGLHRGLWFGLQPELLSFFGSIFGSFNYLGYIPPGHSFLQYFAINLLYISLFLCGIVASVKSYRNQTVLLFFWVMVPVVFLFFLSYYHIGPLTAVRYLIFILPIYLIVISRGIISISQSISQSTNRLNSKLAQTRIQINDTQLFIIFIIILLLTNINIAAVKIGYGTQKEDWEGTANYLNTYTKKDDLIVLFRDPASVLAFYYGGDAKIISLPKEITSLDVVNTTYSNYTKIWFVSSPHSGVNNELLNWLSSNCKVEKNCREGYGSIFSIVRD